MGFLKAEIEVSSSIELVWWAWTRKERLVQWFAPDATIEPYLGGAYELYFHPANRDQMGTKGCIITHFEPKERLGFTWKGPDEFADTMNHEDALTYVLVTLSEAGGKTQVLVEHFGWKEGEEWEKARGWHEMAWSHVLGSLKSALESGEGDLCCFPQAAHQG
ncbi:MULTISPECIES: SRPBCC family protein [Brevibacillus]|uniref:SRPBCC family protein n=1 Tax=Brevibacillus TaxID=55080 RepID=UPI001C8D4AE4|nr:MULTISPECIES: SRPBCC domain-containing protein [Brevibacillus]MBY0087947.1 SRPBCC domain-containing protein [Brevibacillus brevis]MCE0452701.1 SRPBCC domain-containing protein [Brevibacillus sp. AF8]UKK96851.1 SRPBCC domain-containing protein [Brevibacillus brevis]